VDTRPGALAVARARTDPSRSRRARSELGTPRASFGRFGNRLSGAELNLITRQLSTLFEAGLTVDQPSVPDRTSDTLKQQQILAAVRGEVLAGKSLARAMDQFPTVFPELYRTLVNAGEQSGQLSACCRAWRLSRSAPIVFAEIVQALIYPAIVSITALCIVIGLMTYVVPQVVQVFQNTHQSCRC